MPLSGHQITRSGMLTTARLSSQGRTFSPYRPSQRPCPSAPHTSRRDAGGRVPQNQRDGTTRTRIFIVPSTDVHESHDARSKVRGPALARIGKAATAYTAATWTRYTEHTSCSLSSMSSARSRRSATLAPAALYIAVWLPSHARIPMQHGAAIVLRAGGHPVFAPCATASHTT